MILAYMLLGLALVILLHFILQFIANAHPRVIRKAAAWLLAASLLSIVLLLLRFGLTHFAAIVSFISIATPLLQWFKNLRLHVQDTKRAQDNRGHMSLAEAREILGIGANASAREIRTAYRKMMQKNHPDQGGSVYLAGKINEARDILLREKKQSEKS